MNVGLLLHRKENKVPIKKETIYITIYSKERKRVKTATKGHKKRGLKNSPLKYPAKVSTTKVPTTFL